MRFDKIFRDGFIDAGSWSWQAMEPNWYLAACSFDPWTAFNRCYVTCMSPACHLHFLQLCHWRPGTMDAQRFLDFVWPHMAAYGSILWQLWSQTGKETVLPKAVCLVFTSVITKVFLAICDIFVLTAPVWGSLLTGSLCLSCLYASSLTHTEAIYSKIHEPA